jgi:two-component system KDP operon response regulator KdpE
MTRVLVVDDEPQILRALRINLRARHIDVHVAATGAEALRTAAHHPPDLVVLDLGLPDLDGVEVIEGLRGWTDAPIIVLSGRTDSADKVDALDAGADDYVTKPFGIDELLARMRAVTRRAVSAGGQPQVRIGDVTIDFAAKRATRTARAPDGAGPDGAGADGTAPDGAGAGDAGAGGAPATPGTDGGRASTDTGEVTDVRLTPTEWHLIEALVRHPGKLISQRQLLTEVWGPGYADATGNLRLYMAQLRRKLEPDPARPRWLITEPGMGYRFQPGPE